MIQPQHEPPHQQDDQPPPIPGDWLPACASLGDLASPTLASIFRRPHRIGKPSGWWGHVPFAAWVVEACEPRTLVELGTHHGVSFAAFCDAVRHAGLPTRCFAVDHWRGDAHAGHFGDEVYEDLLAFTRQHFSAFSDLVRMDFDAAADTFGDGTIDLLHIDGFHTYEAARHDFDTWKRKLSARAVVLLHDTNVRQGDFGVYRLYAELAADWPHFEFLHGNGLGVIAYGAHMPAAIRQLCAASNGSATLAIRDRFAAVGAVWEGLAREKDAKHSFQLQIEALQGHCRNAEASRDAAQADLAKAHRERDEALAQTRDAVRAERERNVALGRVHLLQARLQEASRAPAPTPLPTPARHEEVEALQSRVLAQAAQLAAAEQAHRELADELAQSTQHHANAARWVEDVQKERSALIEAVAGMREHMAAYASQVGRMVTDLVRRHQELVEPDAPALAPTPPLTAARAGVVQRLRPRSIPASLRWLTPAVQRYRVARHPVAQAVRRSMLFDARWYADTYPDVKRSGIDPAYHYTVFGSREARDPSPWFSTSGYLRNNPDVAQAGTNALYHFEAFGRREQRPFVPSFAESLSPSISAPGATLTTRTPADDPGATFDLKHAFRTASEAALGNFLAREGARMVLPVSGQPAVSIVLVLRDQAGLTFRCLEALATAIDVPAEVIIIDNASSDRTAALLARIDGCRVFTQAENLHFLRGANAGAREARGRHVLFLNNDTQLVRGSLDAACRVLDSQADAGAVGGRIVLLDGTLQEAGSIIWSDGSCVGHGRGQDPNGEAFQFRRDVDYCSGAFLMVRRTLFESLGGFDPLFAPAYYEDTDLCMRVRDAGFRVVYEPAVLLTHFEFGSAASSDTATRLMAQHHGLFVQRHAHTLARSHCTQAEGELVARLRRDGRPSVLVIDDQVPIPSLGAGNPRACDLVNALHEAGALVTHYPIAFPYCDATAAARHLPAELERVTGSGRMALADLLRSRSGMFDIVLVSRPHNMDVFRRACDAVPEFLARTRLVYDAEALYGGREALRREVLGLPAKPSPVSMGIEAELRLARTAAVVLAVSEAEARSFREAGCADVQILGHRMELPVAGATAGFDARRDFLFVGRLDEEDSPNADSVRWFIEEVMPLLDARLGASYRVDIVGGCAPALSVQFGSARVRFHGRVESLQPFYEQARVFLAPTRFAAGIPHKVHEASANGLPCVTTPLIADQLGWATGEALLSAASPADFAAACATLYQDRGLWERLRTAARDRIAQDCDPLRFDRTVQALLGEALHRAASSLPAMPAAVPTRNPADARAAQAARTAKEWSTPPAERSVTQGLFWMSHPQVVPRLNRLASGQPHLDAYGHLKARLIKDGWQLPVRRAASLGCGFGALERGLAGLGMAERIDGYDLAGPAVEEARRLAAAECLQGLHYHVMDLEHEALPESTFDIVFASHSIHHIENLDALFASVRRSLRKGGVFHLSEFIGPDRFQWTDAQLQGINEFMTTLPPKYQRLPSGTGRGPVGRPSVAEVIAVDPSEAVRSSQIVDALRRHFSVDEYRGLGGALLQTGLSGIAQNFDPAQPEDAAHLQRFFDFEDRWMAEGRIGSDFAVITAVRD